MKLQAWPIDKLVFYARNPRKNEAVVDRMCSLIREFGFKIPVLARSNGEVVEWTPSVESRTQTGVLAWRRHVRNPRDPLRRVVGSSGQSV